MNTISMRINFSICIILFLLVFNCLFAQSYNHKQAYDIIINNKIIDTLKSEVYISKWIIPKDTVIELWTENIVVPINSYLFFIDDAPATDWAHPCRYIFFDPNSGSYSVLNKMYPTKNALKQMFLKINKIKWPELNYNKIK